MKHTFESEQQVTDMLIERFDYQDHKINIEWYSNTLFINFDSDDKQSEKSARSVWHYLVDQFGHEHVRISKSTDDYAIDFV